ncbi:MAG TPA: hypothetical protein VFS36_14865 [Chitinophagaceae bacterium]|jgi:hypothetical protein|nr:hypothetical protein [Chitinophagaceae bacterium]
MEKFKFAVKCILLLAMIPILMVVELSRKEKKDDLKNGTPVEIAAAPRVAAVPYTSLVPGLSLLYN